MSVTSNEHLTTEKTRSSAEMASESNDFAHVAGLSPEEITRRYTEWSKGTKYEQDLREEHYKGPQIAASFIAEQFPNKAMREEIYILDVAAGTGFAGEKLVMKGFTKIDAIEPSEGMLNQAIAKNIYTRTFLSYLNENPLQIEPGYYDLALICGGMGEGHIPCSGLDSLIRVVKPGGLIVIVMRENYLTTVKEYNGRLEPKMKEMEIEGKWELVSRTQVPRYSFNNTGIVFMFRVK